MTTLIYVGNSSGCVGRCDSKCYDASEPDCRCICGGRNHGVGRRRAIENTADLVDPDHELRDRMWEMGGALVVVQPELAF